MAHFMIRLENLSFSYTPQDRAILHDLSLEIPPASHVVITGPDRAGKTTFAKLIKGLLEPTSGSISRPPNSETEIGYLGGDPLDSLVGISVEEDIAFGLENLGLSQLEMKERLRKALRSIGLDSIRTRLIESLSGGEQQKVALAGMLAMGVTILVLDEALNMLDRSARCAIRSLLAELRREREMTVIEITNNLQDVLSVRRIILLTSGSVAFDGPPEAFLQSPTGIRWASMTEGMGALTARLTTQGVLSRAPTTMRDIAEILINIINK